MASHIKRQILSHLRQSGLHFLKPRDLQLLPPVVATNLVECEEAQRSQTLTVEVPNDVENIYQNIAFQDKLIKDLHQDYSVIVDKVNVCKSTLGNLHLVFQLNFDYFAKELLRQVKQNPENWPSNVYQNETNKTNKPVIVEYSSPNIAKPFHVGNLRSTIMGHCVANLLQYQGYNVLRMNYLGDWGTQFGILSFAYDHFGQEQLLASEPLKHLYEIYVKGNQEIKNNPDWREAAKKRFVALESKSDSRVFQQWTHFREVSIQELQRLYNQLGVTFDVYSSESDYSNSAQYLLDKLRTSGLVEQSEDGAWIATVPSVVSLDSCKQPIQVPLLKSDGSTLYLTRDISAVLHRKAEYDFERMYYIVDSSQAKHFDNLRSILCAMGEPVYQAIEHVKFGRIIGMSTRRGDAIFLDDLLQECQERAFEAIRASPNTKVSTNEYQQVAETLGVSAIIIHDFANRRVKEYRFNWNKALKLTGDTGISLQYAHARLCSLQRHCKQYLNSDCDINVSSIDTLEGRNLLNKIAIFEQVVQQSCDHLEPSVLAHYLFDLKKAINRANQELTIKGQKEDIAHTRLLLFRCAQHVLNQGMRLLGLKPLNMM